MSNIIIYDCGYQYFAYQWKYLLQNSTDSFPISLKQIKDSNILYKFKRVIDQRYRQGDGNFYVLKQSNTFNLDNTISFFVPTTNN